MKMRKHKRLLNGSVGRKVFPVCAKHKEELFADYGLAIASDEKPCVLCHPRDNDSLGG